MISNDEFIYNKENNYKIKDDDKSYFINEINSNNTTYSQTLNNEKTSINNSIIVKKTKKTPLINQEYIEKIDKLIDEQLEEEYIKLNGEYEQKIEQLLNEQENIFNKNELIKAKYYALEKYLKYYCKKLNVDYESML